MTMAAESPATQSEEPEFFIQETYCAYLDVLGYGALVQDPATNNHEKLKRLISVFINLVSSIGDAVQDTNEQDNAGIKAWSFSDSAYLQCTKVEPLLAAIEQIFNVTFGMYRGHTLKDEWTPMLRCGVAKGWSGDFQALTGLLNYEHAETTPVGPGVARAYWTAEKSGVKGMRVIIAENAFDDIANKVNKSIPFDHTEAPITSLGNTKTRFLKPLPGNVAGKSNNLHELLWPTDHMDGFSYEYIEVLDQLRSTFGPGHMDHFIKTAKLLLDSLELSGQSVKNPTIYLRDKSRLENMIVSAT